MTFPLPLKIHVTPEIARAVMANPFVTLEDLDALIIWIGNEDTMGVEHPLYMAALELQSEMILSVYVKHKFISLFEIFIRRNPSLTDRAGRV